MRYRIAPPRCTPCPDCNGQGGWVVESTNRWNDNDWKDCPTCESGNIWRPTEFRTARRFWVEKPKLLGAA